MIDIVLLCEDRQMDVFACRFLSHRNLGRRRIMSLVSPRGHGAGDQWVRKRFPKELTAVRDRQRAFLIVMIDADSGSTQNRRDQLYRECRDRGVAVPTRQDRVLIAVPKRNIETWFAYLDGQVVDETTKYGKFSRENECKPLADKLFRCTLYPRLRR